jgi:hypothetical protein
MDRRRFTSLRARRRGRDAVRRLRVHPEFHRHLLLVCLAVILSWVLPGPWVQLSSVGFLYLTALLGLRLGPFSRRRQQRAPLHLFCPDTHYLLLAIGTALAQLLWLFSPASLRLTGMPLLGLFTLFIAWSTLRLLRVLADERRIDIRSLCGATAGYLLLGISGGLMLTVLDSVLPGGFQDNLSRLPLTMPPPSLASLGSDRIAWDLDYGRLNYFAFVSLTTLGYGDITPVVPATRLACLLLSVIGPLYIAVVLGVLISRLSSAGAGPAPEPPEQAPPLLQAPPPVHPPPDRSRAPAGPDPGPGASER